MFKKKISFIGTGHIAQAIFQGFMKANDIAGDNFILSNPDLSKLKILEQKYGARLTTDNITAVKWSDIIFITVRPKIVPEVIAQVNKYITPSHLVISAAACIPVVLLDKWFGKKGLKIFRIMPNIPVAYGIGVVGCLGNRYVNSGDQAYIKELLSPLGLVIHCKNDENLEKLSMISGCGTGYVSYFMENLYKVAREYGFDETDAQKIVLATFRGTVEHLKFTQKSFQQMIESIATKGGITEEVLKNLDKSNFYELLLKSIKKGYDKIGKITGELDNK